MFMYVALRNGCYGSTYSHVAKSLKNVDFTKRLEAATKALYICKIQSQLEAFLLNAFSYVLKNLLCEETN